jgi:hypothetical protein
MDVVATVSDSRFRSQRILKGDPMTLFIRQAWRSALAVAILGGEIGSVEMMALADDPFEAPGAKRKETESLVVREVAPKEKPRKEVGAERETREGTKRGLDQAEAKERLVNLERQIDELRAAGKLDQAEKLTREFKELKGNLEERREKKGEKPADVPDKLQGRLKELEAENARLRELVGGKEKGKGGEGKELPIKKSPEKTDGGKKGAEGSVEIQNKLKGIEREIAEHRKAGRNEEAEKLTGVAKELAQHLAKAPPVNKGDVSPEEKEKLQVAHKELAKLRAEGREEEAKRLEQQIQDSVKGELRKKLEQKGFATPNTAPNELGSVLKELREEVHRLRDEVAELRRAVKGSDEKPAPRK